MIHSIMSVNDSTNIEKELIKQFKNNFKIHKRKEIFEANVDECIDIF